MEKRGRKLRVESGKVGNEKWKMESGKWNNE
jgi:hypothetical protein